MDFGSSEKEAKRQAMKWEQKVTKTFLIMLAFFLACYLPSCICIYITNLCSSCSCIFIHWARDVHFLLILANSGVNPFVYAWRFDNFRKAFVKLLTGCGKCWSRRTRKISRVGPLGNLVCSSKLEIGDSEAKVIETNT